MTPAEFIDINQARIAIIGLGYVGLPLAVHFGKRYDTVGYDIRVERVAELRAGRDSTRECQPEDILGSHRLSFSTSLLDIAACNVYIVTVPTPIDSAKRPDLGALIKASESVGSVLKRGDIVIYESTVYPGCTEEDCVPILEKASGLKFNRDFFCGYSPERINPGDKEHRLPNIKKVTSGSTHAVANFVDQLYGSIITAGTHKAPSIRVAEAAKVIENTQRDLNIALVNELAILFNRMGIDTLDVLEAAGTKWNFLPFRPGLVGGHCIGVDPYYLTHKAQQVGHHPDVILAGRRTNDAMARFVVNELIRLMVLKGVNPVGASVLLLGLSFKENCPDIRNSKVVDIVQSCKDYGMNVAVWDPCVDPDEAAREYGIEISRPAPKSCDAVVLAVPHAEFIRDGADDLLKFTKDRAVIYDVKGVLPKHMCDGRL